MPPEEQTQTIQEKAVEKSRLIKLLKAMGVWPGDEGVEEEIAGVEEHPQSPQPPPEAPPLILRRVPAPEPVRIRVPVAVPVPIPVAPGVNPLNKLSSMLPTYFLAKNAAGAEVGQEAYGPKLEAVDDPTEVGGVMQPPVRGSKGIAAQSVDASPIDTPGLPPPMLAGNNQFAAMKGVTDKGGISLDQDNIGRASLASAPSPFDRFLMGKFAQEGYPYFSGGLAPGASLLVAGLGGYGGAQLGSSLAGLGTERAASRQLANVEAQLMDIAKNPHLSGRQKRNLLSQLNREATLHGVKSPAAMPASVGQAEASFKRMSRSLGNKIQARRIPGARGLGIVAGAAAPFILPDFLRNMGIV